MTSGMKSISMSMIFLTFLVACNSKIYELTFKRAHARPDHITAPKVRPFKVKSSFQCLEMCGYLLRNAANKKLCCYFHTITMECECLTWGLRLGKGREIGSSEKGWCSTESLVCQAWARWGECKKNPGYMLGSCRFACTIFADPSLDKQCVWRRLFHGPSSRAYSILDPCKRA